MNIIIGLFGILIIFVIPIWTIMSMILDVKKNIVAWGITLFFIYFVLIVKLCS